MKFVRLPAAKTGAAYGHFQKTALTPIPLSKLRRSMDPTVRAEFDHIAHPASAAGVWALSLTEAAKNLRVWNAINIGDIACFYMDKRFSHYAPITFKWRSDTLQDIVGWTAPAGGAKYSLAFSFGPLLECDLESADYCALVGYRRVPVHSDIHDEEQSAELFEALRLGLSVGPDGSPDDEEGGVTYRVQRLRERSDGNRLKVLDQKGHVCEVCDFDFQAQFGNGFAPSAHVHHKNPLALGTRRAKSVDEFAVLCGPCHVAAHMGVGRKLEPWTVEELRTKIRFRWSNGSMPLR